MPDSVTSKITQSARANYVSWGISLLFAVFIWTYVNATRTEERFFEVPLRVVSPNMWELNSKTVPETIQVLVAGPRENMDGIFTDQLEILCEIKDPKVEGGVYSVREQIEKENVRGLPRSVAIREIRPPYLQLEFARKVKRFLPVQVQFKGEPREGYTTGRIVVDPPYVPVIAPETQFLDDSKNILKTEPIDLTNRSEYVALWKEIQPLPLKEGTVEVKSSVLVNVDIVEKLVQKTFKNVPVRILFASRPDKMPAHKLMPEQVDVTVEGSAALINALSLPSLTVYIVADDNAVASKKEIEFTCHCIVPEGIHVKVISPGKIRWLSAKGGEK